MCGCCIAGLADEAFWDIDALAAVCWLAVAVLATPVSCCAQLRAANNPHTSSLIHGFSSPCPITHTFLHAQASASGLDELEVEHRKLSQLADKAKTLRAQNAQMAGEVANLPELKKAAADLQQQVVQMQHVRQQIQRLQVCGAVRVCVWPFPLVTQLPMSACLLAFSLVKQLPIIQSVSLSAAWATRRRVPG